MRDTTPRPDAERRRALELADLGMSPKGISQHLGVPPSTVRRWIYKRANQTEMAQSFLDLRGRTTRTVSNPTLRFALSGVWR